VKSNLLHSYLEVHNCVAPFTSHGKLHEFGAEKPISRAKPPAHFDIFAIIFTVWSHILSTDGNALRGGCHDVGPLARSESQEVNQQILMMSFLRGGGAGSSSCVKCLLALI
jgi:hypothetical protein